MEQYNYDPQNFAPNFDSEPEAEASAAPFSPVNRISEQHFNSATGSEAEVAPDQEALIKQQLQQELRQADPLHIIVLSLRTYLTQKAFEYERNYASPNSGFDKKARDPINATEIIEKTEQAAKFLNIIFEGMKGPSSNVTAWIRQTSLGLQTELLNFALTVKEYADGGDVNRSSESDFIRELNSFQQMLGQEQIKIETLLGQIR